MAGPTSVASAIIMSKHVFPFGRLTQLHGAEPMLSTKRGPHLAIGNSVSAHQFRAIHLLPAPVLLNRFILDQRLRHRRTSRTLCRPPRLQYTHSEQPDWPTELLSAPAQPSTVSVSTAAWNGGVRVFGVMFINLFVGAFRRTFDQERANAQIDPLTGLGNRRAFKNECSRLELANARDHRILLCGLIDVDDFKSVNDHHGHATGDHVLRIVADALLSAVRPYDATVRLGGDEFAFCLAVRDTASAKRKSSKIHDAVMAVLNQTDYGTTCSLGAATGLDVAYTLRIADQALYRAKDAGKRKWVFQIGGSPSDQ